MSMRGNVANARALARAGRFCGGLGLAILLCASSPVAWAAPVGEGSVSSGAVPSSLNAAESGTTSATLADSVALPAPDASWEAVQLYREGCTLQRERKTERAVDCYLKALECDPGRLEAMPYLALALDTLGRYDDSAAYYEKYLARESDDYLVRLNFAIMLFHAERYAESNEKLEQLALHCAQMPEYHNLLGMLAMHAGQWRDAADSFALAAKLRPAWSEARINLASALLKQGLYARAESELSGVLASSASDSVALNNLGIVQLVSGKVALARESFVAAEEMGSSRGLVNRTLVDMMESGKLDPMVAAEVADANPRMREARLLYVIALYKDQRYADALTELRLLKKEFPKYALAREYEALVLLGLGRNEEALASCEVALSLDNKAPETYHNASLALSGLRSYERALSYARKAYELDKNNSEIVYNLALLADYAGEPAQARTLYNAYLQLGAGSRESLVREHVAELDKLLGNGRGS